MNNNQIFPTYGQYIPDFSSTYLSVYIYIYISKFECDFYSKLNGHKKASYLVLKLNL